MAFLAGGQSHRHAMVLPAGSHVRLYAEPGWREDLTATVRGPRGQTVLPAASLVYWPCHGRSFATGRSGRYELEILATDAGNADPGRYAITVTEVRPLSPSDDDLLQAEARFVRAAAGSDEEALASLNASEELFRRAGSTRGLAAVALQRGLLGLRDGGREAARQALREARSLAAAAGDRLCEGFTEMTLAGDLSDQGETEDVERSYRRAVDLLTGDDPEVLGYAYYHWGEWLEDEGSRHDARQHLERALRLRQAVGNRCGEVGALLALGSVERPLGRLDTAEEHYDRAFEVLRSTPCPTLLENTRLNRAVIDRYRGTPQRALDRLRPLEAELEAAIQRECPGGRRCDRFTRILRSTYDNIALSLSDLGQLEAALEKHERALERGGGAWSRTLKGWILHKLERSDEAEAEFRTVLAGDAVRPSTRAYALHGLGRLARDQGRVEDARDLLREALTLHRERGTQAGIISALQELGKLYLDAGDWGPAASFIDQALAASEALQDPERHATSLVLQAQLRQRQGDLDGAHQAYGEALRLREEQRSAVTEGELRTSFVERWGSIYEEYVDLLMELHDRAPGAGYDALAFEVSERSRARSLVELLREAEIDVLARVDEGLATRYHQAFAEISAVSMSLASRAPSEAAAIELDRAELRRHRAELQAVRDEIVAASPKLADLLAPPSSSLADLQRGLGPGDALLEYTLGDRRSVLFVLTRDAFAAVRLGASAGEIAALVAASLPKGEFEPGDGEAAAALYRVLVAPAESLISSARRLLVVPHRDLLLLPFELLRLPGTARGPDGYLVSRWEVAYGPSATVLRSLAGSEPAGTAPGLDFVAFAPSFAADRKASSERGGDSFAPLLNAREEVETIAHTLYSDTSKLYLDEQASESRVKSDPVVHHARRLHFATHGLTATRAELLGLVLPEPEGHGASPAEDGLLRLDEIFQLELDSDLVVLSACETARGEQTRVEGLVGFGRAFFAAGVPSVVASLWKVDDRSTARLMEELYRRLEAGMTKSAALQAAKLHLLANNWPASYHWAPFILVGRPD
ncbi:MAG TPA: CHAT domain-containing protein [Thermoanaerobaculia bacterium]|nr:CHAT domain-containing protein [Thermoanaerobaculia bacterium]